MNSIARLAYAATFLAGISFATTIPAQATAFAGVNEAVWEVKLEYAPSLPDGVSLSCFGGAFGGGTGCAEFGSLTITNNSAEEITKSLSLVGGLTITNSTDADIDLPLFGTGFSAFNPGGNSIGASVDDAAVEYAAFSSSVSGPGVGDFHGCAVGNGPGSLDTFPGPAECGVGSPDASEEDLYLGTLDAGQTLTETYYIDITATARGLPEPTTLAIFGTALFGAMAIRRRKSKAT